MASGIRETTKPQLEIYLEKPFGGVASNADPVDIQDNQMVTCQGVVDINGTLCQVNIVAPVLSFKFVPHVSTAVPILIFNYTNQLYALDQFGNIYILESLVGPPPSTVFGYIATADVPWGIQLDDVISISILNGIVYLGVYADHSIYTWDGSSLTLASNYTGGKIMGVLDDYLLQMNTNNTTDGIQPTRVNWSGPGEFSTWDPSIDRTAGFNTLVNIEDAITGFISLASVGIIVGEKGLVEMSPTGIGIEPFSFTVLWTSEVGQGILYPLTVVQYGQNTYASTDTGVFKISTGGFQEISGVARTAIYELVQVPSSEISSFTNSPVFFAGTMLLYAYNSAYATPYYIFTQATPQIAGVPSHADLFVWLYNIETGAWYNFVIPVDTLINEQNGTSGTNGIVQNLHATSFTLPFFIVSSDIVKPLPSVLIYGTASYGGTILSFVASLYIYNKTNADSAFNTPGNLNIVTKAWEMKLGRQPTVRRVIVKAYGSGDIALSVNGISFGTITLDGTTVTKVYKSPKGIYTGLDPQLTLSSSNFKGVIIKAMMAGTYADGDID